MPDGSALTRKDMVFAMGSLKSVYGTDDPRKCPGKKDQTSVGPSWNRVSAWRAWGIQRVLLASIMYGLQIFRCCHHFRICLLRLVRVLSTSSKRAGLTLMGSSVISQGMRIGRKAIQAGLPAWKLVKCLVLLSWCFSFWTKWNHCVFPSLPVLLNVGRS
jgi:hypothetical protein